MLTRVFVTRGSSPQGTSFLIWDVGGQEKIRPLWRSYTRCTDGIVFVVDSVDLERLEEARCELYKTAKLPENAQVCCSPMAWLCVRLVGERNSE